MTIQQHFVKSEIAWKFFWAWSLFSGADPGYVKRGGRDPKGGGVADITRK